MRRFRRAWLGLPLMAAAFAPSAALAEGTRPLVYAGDAYFAPYEYLDGEGQPAGFDVELVRALAREGGRSIEVRLLPWRQVLQDFEARRVDIVSLPWSEARAER